MSMFARIGSWFAIHDEEEDDLYAPDEVGAKRNVVPISEARGVPAARSRCSRRARSATSPRSPMRCARARS